MEAFDTIPLPPTQWMSVEQLRPLGRDVTPGGGSALYDAINIACEERMRAEASAPARRVLLLLSDGEDNNSRTKLEDAIACAQKAGVVIFAISTAEGVTNGGRTLKKLSEQTGGYAFVDFGGRRQVPNVISAFSRQLNSIYQVTYIPADVVPPATFRRTEIKVISDKKLRVRAPSGHYAP